MSNTYPIIQSIDYEIPNKQSSTIYRSLKSDPSRTMRDYNKLILGFFVYLSTFHIYHLENE